MATPPHSPNVLLICTDHWPGLLMGEAGHDRILTPTLDQLAANGVRFSQAYTATPTCIPARRALMTGTTARTHGDRSFDEHLLMDPNLPTLPQVFGDSGYQTNAVGKLHVYPQRDRIGFDEVISCEEGRHHLGGDGRDDFERFSGSRGIRRPGAHPRHGEQPVRGAAVALARALSPDKLDRARDVPHHPAPRPDPTRLLVLLFHRAPSTNRATARLSRPLRSHRRRRADRRRLGCRF